jgi:hypothetical protein
MPPNRPFEACNGHLSELCSFVRLRRVVTSTLKPFIEVLWSWLVPAHVPPLSADRGLTRTRDENLHVRLYENHRSRVALAGSFDCGRARRTPTRRRTADARPTDSEAATRVDPTVDRIQTGPDCRVAGYSRGWSTCASSLAVRWRCPHDRPGALRAAAKAGLMPYTPRIACRGSAPAGPPNVPSFAR